MGKSGMIVQTGDGGRTWHVRTRGRQLEVNSVFFHDRRLGWALADGPLIVRTTDGGRSWHDARVIQSAAFGEPFLRDIFFVTPRISWAVGSQMVPGGDETVILKSTDGGANWTRQDTGSVPWIVLSDVQFIDTETGWAALRRSCGSGRDFASSPRIWLR